MSEGCACACVGALVHACAWVHWCMRVRARLCVPMQTTNVAMTITSLRILQSSKEGGGVAVGADPQTGAHQALASVPQVRGYARDSAHNQSTCTHQDI